MPAQQPIDKAKPSKRGTELHLRRAGTDLFATLSTGIKHSKELVMD